MSYSTTIEKKFIETAIKWNKDIFVIRQDFFSDMWVQKGYIKVNIDMPMSEYSFVQVELTDLGRATIYGELL